MLVTRLFCVFALLFPVGAAIGQQPKPDKQAVIEGETEMAVGCPVALSEASYVLTEQLEPEQLFKITRETVKITNTSGREVKKVIVAFSFEGRGIGRVNVLAGPIGVGETYKLISGGYRSSPAKNDGRFVVRPLAVEFADGSHWVTPRTVYNRLHQYFPSQLAPLVIKQCHEIDRSYRLTLELKSDQVVAYRLGVVKDTQDGFEVQVGRWVEVPQSASRKGDHFSVKADDSVVSLAQGQIFKREKYVIDFYLGRPITDLCGVALFVAEARLADGTVWRQNLQRDELLWNEVRQ